MPPAARMGDMTAHGGAIVLGFPMVLIGGQPAARMGDMHMCPMLTPGLPPIPHVGGPVMLGSPMVLIGGQPAARMGDMLLCVGPPDTILMGCPTVMIGGGGSGSASGGGGGSAGAGAAVASASAAQSGSKESSTKADHWAEFAFEDKAGNPVSNLQYEFTGPDGKKSQSTLPLDGKVKRDGMSKGDCKIRLSHVCNARWSKTSAKVGEKVKLSADTEGFNSNQEGVFQIYRRDISHADVQVAELQADVRGNKLEAEWEYPAAKKGKDAKPVANSPASYSAPEFYFEVIVGPCKARSSLLHFEDYIELSVKDEKGNSLANEEYVLHLPDGSMRKGKLDGQGHKKEEKVPAGRYTVKFPNLPGPKK